MNDNQQKFADMVQQNKSTIYTVCYMFSKDQDEVNDLFQEVLIRLSSAVLPHPFPTLLPTKVGQNKKNRPQNLVVSHKSTTFAPAFTKRYLPTRFQPLGEMVEWSITPVLKTGVPRGTGGSNPSLSAKISVTSCKTTSCADFSFKGAPNLRRIF